LDYKYFIFELNEEMKGVFQVAKVGFTKRRRREAKLMLQSLNWEIEKNVYSAILPFSQKKSTKRQLL